jgi:hypothetical protein
MGKSTMLRIKPPGCTGQEEGKEAKDKNSPKDKQMGRQSHGEPDDNTIQLLVSTSSSGQNGRISPRGRRTSLLEIGSALTSVRGFFAPPKQPNIAVIHCLSRGESQLKDFRLGRKVKELKGEERR